MKCMNHRYVSRTDPGGFRAEFFQIPPFNDQANVQAISSDIAVLLSDWVEAARRPQSSLGREFPVGRVDQAINQYLTELEPGQTDTKALYEEVKRLMRRHW
jgi:nuclear pore complex protein Nup155